MELVAILLPWEIAGVDDAASYLCGMSVHILRCGMCHYVTAPLEWPAVDRCGEGVVDDEGHAMLVGHLREALYIEHIASRVGYRLSEEAFGVRAEGSLYALIIPVGVDECTLYAELSHRHAEEIVCPAIYGV